ncbi:hypothetical protein [Micromonospora sp. NPDC049282]|uniref:hypothetical protein n=1 Tax=Micromonospora sp. NPDC049282 TaxID=3364269 RepID=UPI003715EBDF
MQVRQLGGEGVELFLTHSSDHRLAACVGVKDNDGEVLRVNFGEDDQANVLIVGRSRTAALGIFTAMLLDLARQLVTTPGRRAIYTTPPFSVLDFSGTAESRTFTEAAMSLPLPVKLERATDTAMTTLTDFQFELLRRRRQPDSPRHAKFLFLCALQAAHNLRSRGSYALAESKENAAKFGQILRDGARQSLFTVVWCNSFENIALTLDDGVRPFRHIIVLHDVAALPEQLAEILPEPGRHAWVIDRSRATATPVIPYVVPSQSWCDMVIGAFE